jgi:hypothetical protein
MTQVVIISIAVAIENVILWSIAYNFGIKTEQRARIRRLNTLRKLLNGKV